MTMNENQSCTSKIYFSDSQRHINLFDSMQKQKGSHYRRPVIWPMPTEYHIKEKVSEEEILAACRLMISPSVHPARIYDAFVFSRFTQYFYRVCQEKQIPFNTIKSLIEEIQQKMHPFWSMLGGIQEFFQPITKMNMIWYESQFLVERNQNAFARHYKNAELLFLDVSTDGRIHSFVPFGMKSSCFAPRGHKKYDFLQDLSSGIVSGNSDDHDTPCYYLPLSHYKAMLQYYPEDMKDFVELEREKLANYFDKEKLDGLDFFELSNAQENCYRKLESISREEEEEVVEIWVGSKITVVPNINSRYKEYYVYKNPQHRIKIVNQ